VLWAAALLPSPRVAGGAPSSIEGGDCQTTQESASPGRWSPRLRCRGRALGLSAYHSAFARQDTLEAARTVISNDLEQEGVPVPGGTRRAASDIKTVEADADKALAILQGSLGMRVFRYVPDLNDQTNGMVSLVDIALFRQCQPTSGSLLGRPRDCHTVLRSALKICLLGPTASASSDDYKEDRHPVWSSVGQGSLGICQLLEPSS
jgi:hypothetical protein